MISCFLWKLLRVASARYTPMLVLLTGPPLVASFVNTFPPSGSPALAALDQAFVFVPTTPLTPFLICCSSFPTAMRFHVRTTADSLWRVLSPPLCLLSFPFFAPPPQLVVLAELALLQVKQISPCSLLLYLGQQSHVPALLSSLPPIPG